MQVFGAGQVHEEKEHCANMKPPEDAIEKNVGAGIQAAKERVEPCAYRRPGTAVIGGGNAVGSGIGGVLKAFDQRQGEDDGHDESQDDIAIPGAMQGTRQLFGADDGAAKGEKEQSDENKNNERIQHNGKDMIISEER